MSTISPSLPPKFNPHILGSDNQPELYAKVQKAFIARSLKPLKPVVVHLFGSDQVPSYIIKTKRSDDKGKEADEAFQSLGRPNDMLPYSVRKAAKIQELIERYNLQDHVRVPKEWLFWDEESKQWCVIAEKIELAEVFPALNPEYKASVGQSWYEASPEELTDPIKEIINNETKARRELTPEQVRALAIFAMEAGLTDLNLSNIQFDTNGKLAIVDTLPTRRSFKKMMRDSWVIRSGIFDLRGAIFTKYVISTSLIRLCGMTPEAKRALCRVENGYLTKYLASAAIRAAILILAWSYAAMLPLMFAPLVAKAVIGLALVQVAMMTFQCCYSLHLSRNGGVDGMLALREAEKQGFI